MQYKINLIMMLFIFQFSEVLSSQHSYQRSEQVIREISDLFPQDTNTQSLLAEYLSNHKFISLLEYLMNRSSSVDLLPYIREYESLKGSPMRENVRIFFVRYLQERALCRYPFIFIDIGGWQLFTENAKKVLLFHELGHCDLMRRHESKETLSIMSEQNFLIDIAVFNSKTNIPEYGIGLTSRVQENLDFLYEELFSKENDFAVDVRLWIQDNQNKGRSLPATLSDYFQGYFYNAIYTIIED